MTDGDEVLGPLIPQAAVHSFGPAFSGVAVCSHCGFVATPTNLDEIPETCEDMTVPDA